MQRHWRKTEVYGVQKLFDVEKNVEAFGIVIL